MSDNIKFKDRIKSCYNSSDEFVTNSSAVQKELDKQNKESIKVYLDVVEEVMKDPVASPEVKFYNLSLLKTVTEKHNPLLLSYLATRKNLFKIMEEQACYDSDKTLPEKGNTFFSKKPGTREKVTGTNYLILMLEIIKFWNNTYTIPDKSKSNAFRDLYNNLVRVHGVTFPSSYKFYKVGDTKANEPQGSVQTGAKKISMSQSSKKLDEANLRDAKEKIEALKSSLEELKELYSYHKTESEHRVQFATFLYETLLENQKEITQTIKKFEENLTDQNRSVLDEMLVLKEKAVALKENYRKYKKKELTYDEHRKITLQIIAATDTLSLGTTGKESSNTGEKINLQKMPNELTGNRNDKAPGQNKLLVEVGKSNNLVNKGSVVNEKQPFGDGFDQNNLKSLPKASDSNFRAEKQQDFNTNLKNPNQKANLKLRALQSDDVSEDSDERSGSSMSQGNQNIPRGYRGSDSEESDSEEDKKNTKEQRKSERKSNKEGENLTDQAKKKQQQIIQGAKANDKTLPKEEARINLLAQTGKANPSKFQELDTPNREKQDALKAQSNMDLITRVNGHNDDSKSTQIGQNLRSEGKFGSKEGFNALASKQFGSDHRNSDKESVGSQRKNRFQNEDEESLRDQPSMTDPNTNLPRSFGQIDANPEFQPRGKLKSSQLDTLGNRGPAHFTNNASNNPAERNLRLIEGDYGEINKASVEPYQKDRKRGSKPLESDVLVQPSKQNDLSLEDLLEKEFKTEERPLQGNKNRSGMQKNTGPVNGNNKMYQKADPQKIDELEKEEESDKEKKGRQKAGINQPEKETNIDGRPSEGRTSEDMTTSGAVIKNMRGKLRVLKNIFKEILDLYESKKTEAADVELALPFYYKDLSEHYDPIIRLTKKLELMHTEQSERLLDQLEQLNQKVARLRVNLERYKNKAIKYAEHRSVAMQILSSANDLFIVPLTAEEKTQKKDSVRVVDNPQKTNKISGNDNQPKGLEQEGNLLEDDPSMSVHNESTQRNLPVLGNTEFVMNMLQENSNREPQKKPDQNLRIENRTDLPLKSNSKPVTQIPREFHTSEVAPSFKSNERSQQNQIPVENNRSKPLNQLQNDYFEESLKRPEIKQDKRKVESYKGYDEDMPKREFQGQNGGNDMHKLEYETIQKSFPQFSPDKGKGTTKLEEDSPSLSKGQFEHSASNKLELSDPNKRIKIWDDVQEGKAFKGQDASKINTGPKKAQNVVSSFTPSKASELYNAAGSHPNNYLEYYQDHDSSRKKSPQKIVAERQVIHASNLADDKDDSISQKESLLYYAGTQSREQYFQGSSNSGKDQRYQQTTQAPPFKKQPENLKNRMAMKSMDLNNISPDQKLHRDGSRFAQSMTHSKRTELSRSADRYSHELASIGSSIKRSLHRTKNFASPRNFNSASSHFGWPQQRQHQNLHKSDIIAYNRPMEPRSFKSIEEEYQLQKQSKILRSPVGSTSQDANKDNNLSKKPATHQEKAHKNAYASNPEEDQYFLRKENEKLQSSGQNDRNTQKLDSRKAIISNLQKQLNDNQNEFEMLRNQNMLIESQSNVSNEDSLVYKMEHLEAENLRLKNELDRIMKEIKMREQNKHVNERFQVLSEENKQLANKLSSLKRTHDTMDLQFEEHVQVEGTINHARAVNQRSQPKPQSNGFRMTPENRPFNQENAPTYSSNAQSANQLVTPRGVQEKDRFANLPNPVNYFPADPFPSDLDARFSDSHTIAEEKTAHHIAKQKPREMIFESPKQPIRATATAISTEVVKSGSVTRTSPKQKSSNNLVFNFQKSSVDTIQNLSKQEIPSENMSRGQLSSKLNSAKKDTSKHDTMLQSPPIQVSRSSIRDKTANQERQANNYIETHENADMILQSDSETQTERNRFTEPENNRKNAPEARATKNRDYDSDWARKTLQEEQPGQRELDHKQPLEPTQQYKLNEKSTASEVDIIDELRNRLLEDPWPDSLHYFKMGCLKNKFVIFENEFMQIGASSNHFQDQVRIVLFFDSKIDEEITKFSTYLIGGLNLEVVLKPEKVDPIIVPGRQTKQMILLSLIDIPISCLKMSCEGVCGDQQFEFSFFLPTMINKFMDLKSVEPEDFHEYWESNYQSVLRSDVFEINSAIVKKAADFDKYITNLIDVGLDDESILIKNQENIKVGAVFELKNLDSDYAIKIHFSESQQAVFEIATSGENLEGAKFILQSLIFLFEQ